MKWRKGWRMSSDVGEVKERLENELWRRWSDRKVGEWALLRHSSFFNPSFASPTSQALHLRLLASRPCFEFVKIKQIITNTAVLFIFFKIMSSPYTTYNLVKGILWIFKEFGRYFPWILSCALKSCSYYVQNYYNLKENTPLSTSVSSWFACQMT